MKLNCEYTIKVKIQDLFYSKDDSEKDIKEKILNQGRKMLSNYYNNTLFDPDKKIFFESTNYELNLDEHYNQ